MVSLRKLVQTFQVLNFVWSLKLKDQNVYGERSFLSEACIFMISFLNLIPL